MITSLVTAVPVVGHSIVDWLWGGFTVNAPTLRRFYSVHFLLPFIIAGVTLIHLALLHKDGSNSPIGSDTGVDDVPFYPYYSVPGERIVFAHYSVHQQLSINQQNSLRNSKGLLSHG